MNQYHRGGYSSYESEVDALLGLVGRLKDGLDPELRRRHLEMSPQFAQSQTKVWRKQTISKSSQTKQQGGKPTLNLRRRHCHHNERFGPFSSPCALGLAGWRPSCASFGPYACAPPPGHCIQYHCPGAKLQDIGALPPDNAPRSPATRRKWAKIVLTAQKKRSKVHTMAVDLPKLSEFPQCTR